MRITPRPLSTLYLFTQCCLLVLRAGQICDWSDGLPISSQDVFVYFRQRATHWCPVNFRGFTFGVPHRPEERQPPARTTLGISHLMTSCRSQNRQRLLMFAKGPSAVPLPLHEAVITPALNASMLWETWQHGENLPQVQTVFLK